MAREIVLDTETTGLDPFSGHRILEIGCVELQNYIPTGQVFHQKINPEREVPEDAVAIHGMSWDSLKGEPVFSDIAEKFLDFIGDAPLIIHNAAFDLKFLNAELAALDKPAIDPDRAIDTVQMARRKFPGSPASLDALCRRFAIDLSQRSLHGALLDCELLAAVYLELIGGRQSDLTLEPEQTVEEATATAVAPRVVRPVRAHVVSDAEQSLHKVFLEKFVTDPIWHASEK